MPAALERSRSGRGGPVWLFFEDAVPATLARRLGAPVLTETMERRPDIGLESYDRFFPNQDTLPPSACRAPRSTGLAAGGESRPAALMSR